MKQVVGAILVGLCAGVGMASVVWAEEGAPPPPVMMEEKSVPVVPLPKDLPTVTVVEPLPPRASDPVPAAAQTPAQIEQAAPPDSIAPVANEAAEPAPAPVAEKPASDKKESDGDKQPKKKKSKKTKEKKSSAQDPFDLDPDQKGKEFSLQEALHETYLHNPTLRAARAATKATFEKLPQALAGWLPSATASGGVTYSTLNRDPGGTTKNTEKEAAVSVSQSLYRGGRTVAGTRAATALIDAQLGTLASAERSVLYQAVVSYMDVLQARAVVNVNEQNRKVIDRQLKATQDRFNVGDVTRTDVAQSEFRLARAQADLTAAGGSLRATRAVFEQVVGMPPENLVLPGPSAFSFPSSTDEAAHMAETYNPDVIAAQARELAAKENVDIEFGSLLPDVSVNAGASMTRDPSGFALDGTDAANVGVSASMPLYEGGATRSRVRAAKYTANELYMKVIEAKRAAREEAVRAFENLNTAQAELISRQAQVRAAEIARDGVRAEAEQGERTILDALDADLEVRDAQVAMITARRNKVVAEYALASALGMLVPGNIGISDKVFDPDSFGRGTLLKMFSVHADTEDEVGK